MTLYYKTLRSYSQGERSFEPRSEEPSQTVPGEARTIKQLLQNALQGLSADERQVNYFDEENLDNINHFFAPGLDLTDLDDLRRKNQAAMAAIEAAERKRKAAELEAAEDAKAEARLKAKAEKAAKQKAAAPTDPKPGEEPES